MKPDKILLFLFIGLSIAVIALYFYTKSKNAKKTVEKFPLVLGSTGKAVKILQVLLDVPMTGTYDAATVTAVAKVWGLDSVDSVDFLGHVDWEADSANNFPLGMGDKGPYVETVQILLGLDVTGTFDSKTASALKATNGQTQLSLINYRNLIFNTLGV